MPKNVGRFGQNYCCQRLLKLAQSPKNCQIWSHWSQPNFGPQDGLVWAWLKISIEGSIGLGWPKNLVFFKKNGPTPAAFSIIFKLNVFSNNQYNFYNKYVRKCPSSIRCRDSNPPPSERQSLPITTRPGLPPSKILFGIKLRSVNCFRICKSIPVSPEAFFNNFAILLSNLAGRRCCAVSQNRKIHFWTSKYFNQVHQAKDKRPKVFVPFKLRWFLFIWSSKNRPF